MIKCHKLWLVGSVMIMAVCTIVMMRLFLLPRPKMKAPDYTMGMPIPKNADYYLHNVSKEDRVSVDEQEFQAGERIVKVTFNGVRYHVPVTVVFPDVNAVTKTVPFRRVLTKGGALDTLFGVDEQYKDDVTYSIDADNVTLGKHDVVLRLFDQTVVQKVEIIDHTTVPGRNNSQYDFTNSDLITLVKSYMAKNDIEEQAVSFVYTNSQTQEKVAFNSSKTMLAAETEYLPLSLLVFDEIKKGQIDKSQHLAYVQSLLLVDSTDAKEALLNMLGGKESVYAKLSAYGKSTGVVPTVSATSQQTTADYIHQVTTHLYKNAQQYEELVDYMKQANPQKFIARFLGETPVAHKTGYIGQVINDTAIVYERVPYILTLLTRDITAEQFVEIAYIINEWHKQQQ